jgi:hypothetical protein
MLLPVVTAWAIAACGEEGPIGVGGGLLPPGVITIDTVLEPADYLVFDTTFTGYTRPYGALWVVVARDFGGVLDASALVRFDPAPGGVTYLDADGVSRFDSLPTYLGGTIVFSVDTARSEFAEPVTLHLYEVAEAWDPRSATWTLRVDTPGVSLPWLQEGGTAGPLIDSGVLELDSDSVVFSVDSAVIARWRDTTDAGRGALLVSETPGVRLRSTGIGTRTPFLFRLDAVPSARPDTVVTAVATAVATTFVYAPEPPEENELRIGGVPASRGVLRFREDLRESLLGLPCTGPAPDCLRLRDATVNSARLVLQPIAVPPHFVPEDSLRFRARVLAVSEFSPPERAPLGDTLRVTRPVPPTAFVNASPEVVEFDITRFMAAILAPLDDDARTPSYDLALLAAPEISTFGYARFAAAPRLRLILTVQPREGGP